MTAHMKKRCATSTDKLVRPYVRSGLLIAALAAAVPSLAQGVPPDAGETLRELRQQPSLTPPRGATSLLVPADADVSADPGQKFYVSQIRIDGNVSIPTSELQPLVDGVTGREATLGELRQAAARITAAYRERGFVVARGFVPAQSIDAGVVQLMVLEGSLHSSTVLNHSPVHLDVLEGVVAAQKLEGRVIRSAEMDRELLLLADLPAVGSVTGQLKPGAEVGTSDLFVSVEPGHNRDADVSIDNYGNRYTGMNRLTGHIAFNSPRDVGDKLDLRVTTTDRHLYYGRIAYDTPANSDGLRAGVALSSSSYELGREFANLDAHGTANTASLYALYPALRGLNANVWLSGSLDYRKLNDEIRSTNTDTRKHLTAATLGGYGDLADSLGGGAYSTWNASAVFGSLGIESEAAQLIDQAGPRTSGSYQKIQLAFTRLQAISAHTSAFLSVSGQRGSKNLDSSEKFVIGGIYGVRAYPQGEGAGDDGVLGTAELRQDLTAGLQGSVFADAGHVRFSRDAYAPGSNTETLKGYGLGLNARYGDLALKATVAWRSGQAPLTAPDRKPRFWISATWWTWG